MDIFEVLIDSNDALTPTEIGEQIESNRQQVMYHLDTLVRLGLAVHDEGDGEYRAQPAFFEESVINQVDIAMSMVEPVIRDSVVIDEEIDPEDEDVIVNNCLKMVVTMSLTR